MDLTPTALRDALRYDMISGQFIWRRTLSSRAVAGTRAGWVNSRGYRQVKLLGRGYMAHRLAWLHTYGEWPQSEVDHANGEKLDNSLGNLRLATRSQNQRNVKRPADNTSGVKGVSRSTSGKWRAWLHINGRQVHLGNFENFANAVAARQRAAREAHGEFYCEV
jgi:hypothetical protein